MIDKMLSQMKQLSTDERAALYEAMKQEVAKNTRVVIDGNEYEARLTKIEKPITGYERIEEGYSNNQLLSLSNLRVRNLSEQLRQWQALNDDPIDWSDTYHRYWCIDYNYEESKFDIGTTLDKRTFGTIYFSTADKAKEAIEVFKDDLLWFYVEYRQRLDEVREWEESIKKRQQQKGR